MSVRTERAGTVVVVAGGGPLDPRLVTHVPAGAFVVAADSGADHALALGLTVDHLVGDLDSVSELSIARIERTGAIIDRHPRAKDATDLELALRAADAMEPDDVIVLGASGGELDHHLGALLLLCSPWLAPARVQAWQGSTLLSVVRAGDRLALDGSPGSLVSLVPVLGAAGAVEGITTTGLRYRLAGESLPLGSSRGLRNEMSASAASLTVRSGTLLVLQIGLLDRDPGEQGS